MLRRMGAYLVAAALVLIGGNAFRQVPNEFRDTEPGSLLFGVLQLVIGSSALIGAVGVLRRARWASLAIGIAGIAAVALLVSLPLFDPMDPDARQAIWFGAALVGMVAAGFSWCAHWLSNPSSAATSTHRSEELEQPTATLHRDAKFRNAQLADDNVLTQTPPATATHVAPTARRDAANSACGRSQTE